MRILKGENPAKAGEGRSRGGDWLRGQDLNLRPSGYGPDELPGSPPRTKEEFLREARGERQGHRIENCKC